MKKNLVFLILSLSSFFAFGEGLKLACLPEQDVCRNCPESINLFPTEQFSKEVGSLDIEADQSEILANQNYFLNGDVKVKSDKFILGADNVEVSSSDETTIASGNVRFQDNAFLISGDTLEGKRDDERNLIATVTNANYQDYMTGIGGANGIAEVIEKKPTSIFLKNATYSLCPVNKNDWLIDADQIELNLKRNRGIADNAKIFFYGVPIFYLPKYSWVLKGRGSGFLTPDYDNYKESARPGENPKTIERSFKFRIPYYFNIAPDRDLIVALTYMSSRGFIYEGKYRQLIAPKISEEHNDSIWKLEANYLPEDRMEYNKRWLLDTSVEIDFNERLNLSSRYYRVSDKEYFKEVLRTNTSAKRLSSDVKISYDDTNNEFSASLLTDHEQIVNAGSAEYTKDLEGVISKRFRFGKNKLDSYNYEKNKLKLSTEEDSKYISENPAPIITNLVSDFESTKFAHSNILKESGIRTFGKLTLSRQLQLKFPVITPYVSSSLTHYSLNNAKDISRTIGGAGLSIDFSTSRQTKLFNTEVNHKFMPIIRYDYRAKKLQGNIPIFDSKDKHDDILTFADLTSGERYTGLDRITNANDINLSLESSYRKIDAIDTDKDLLNLKITQSFYTDDEVVSDTTATNYETRLSYSDIAAPIGISIDDYSLSSAVQFDPAKSLIVKKENVVSYSPESRKFISLSYSDDSVTRTGKVYAAYPINSSIHMFGGLDRKITKATRTGIINSYTTGIAYESCCWALRLAHFQEDKQKGDFSNNYSTGLELVLKGLGSTATPLKGKLESNIPGYIAWQ